MIRKIEMYEVVCDRCGKHEEQMFDTMVKALYVSLWRDWAEIDGHLYCPDCIYWDEETKSYKPKEKKQ